MILRSRRTGVVYCISAQGRAEECAVVYDEFEVTRDNAMGSSSRIHTCTVLISNICFTSRIDMGYLYQ